jgi:hypothetical protein
VEIAMWKKNKIFSFFEIVWYEILLLVFDFFEVCKKTLKNLLVNSNFLNK